MVGFESTINRDCFRFSGESLSNTLVFELRHQWTGLLVEANPFAYRQLREKQRKYEKNATHTERHTN